MRSPQLLDNNVGVWSPVYRYIFWPQPGKTFVSFVASGQISGLPSCPRGHYTRPIFISLPRIYYFFSLPIIILTYIKSLTGRPLPQRSHHHAELRHRDRTILVLVEQHERFLEL